MIYIVTSQTKQSTHTHETTKKPPAARPRPIRERTAPDPFPAPVAFVPARFSRVVVVVVALVALAALAALVALVALVAPEKPAAGIPQGGPRHLTALALLAGRAGLRSRIHTYIHTYIHTHTYIHHIHT